MSLYQVRPETIEAVQWMKVGDHPKDTAQKKVIVPYRKQGEDGAETHPLCGRTRDDHGWWANIPGKGRMVCPGDYIVKDVAGPYPRRYFEADYEPVTT